MFEKSEFYKKALIRYKEEKYNHLLKPDNVIAEDDVVFL